MQNVIMRFKIRGQLLTNDQVMEAARELIR